MHCLLNLSRDVWQIIFVNWNRQKSNAPLLFMKGRMLTVPMREIFDSVIDLLSSECEVLTVNPDEHFMNVLIYALLCRKKKVNGSVPTPLSKKWSEAFVHLRERNVPHGNMNVVEPLL
jgi:hypothetical protein